MKFVGKGRLLYLPLLISLVITVAASIGYTLNFFTESTAKLLVMSIYLPPISIALYSIYWLHKRRDYTGLLIIIGLLVIVSLNIFLSVGL